MRGSGDSGTEHSQLSVWDMLLLLVTLLVLDGGMETRSVTQEHRADLIYPTRFCL